MYTFEQLIAEIQTRGARQAEADVESVRKRVKALGQEFSDLSKIGGLLVVLANLRDFLETLGEVTGVTVAAKFQGMAIGLRSIIGDTEKFNRLWKELKELGKESPFSTEEIVRFGTQMAAAGVKTEKIAGEMKKLIDALAVSGMEPGSLSSVLFNLLQIRSMDTAKASFADIRQMLTRAPGLARTLAAGLGIPQSELLPKLRGKDMSGAEVYEALLKGADAINKGAAAAQLLSNPLTIVTKMFENLRMAMEPTGQLLLTALLPALKMVNEVIKGFRSINEITKGVAGLVVLIGVGLVVAARVATIATAQLIATLYHAAIAMRYAAASNAGAGVSGVIAGAAGMGSAAMGAVAALPPVIIGVIAAAITAGIYALGEKIAGDSKGEGLGGWAGGSMKQFALGPILGPVLSIIKAFENFFGGKAGTGADRQIEEQKKTNAHLEEIKSKLIGGGPGVSSAISNFEAEYAVSRALQLGFG